MDEVGTLTTKSGCRRNEETSEATGSRQILYARVPKAEVDVVALHQEVYGDQIVKFSYGFCTYTM
jgi:hypothetical protein